MYPDRVANGPIGGVNPAPSDTLANRLSNIQEIVRETEDAIQRIRLKVFGPNPDSKQEEGVGVGVNHQVMDIRTHALRIRDQILELDAYLA